MRKFEYWRMFVVVAILVGGTLVALPTVARDSRIAEVLERRGGIKGMTLGLDLRGGMDLTYQVMSADKTKWETMSTQERYDLASRTKEVLVERLDTLGVGQQMIQVQGNDQIRLQIPIQDVTHQRQIKEIISRQHFLSFHEVINSAPSAAMLDASSDDLSILEGVEARKSGKPSGEALWYLLRKEPEITGEFLQHSEVGRDEFNNPTILFYWNSQGATRFGEVTQRLVGKQLAIVLAGKVYTAPVVKSKITSNGVIEGDFELEEAKRLVKVLKVGALPAELKPLAENTVGPTLGKDSIRRGVRASIFGAMLVALFMLGVYRLSGVFALVALLCNLLLQLGLLVTLGATLTLPGIAGFALTVGMAVDANVLIFERIKEELKHGKPVRAAVAAGYDKAFVAIFDSNITTILTGLVLYYFGTGPIRGFAVTLLIGLTVNLFTALWVTRVFQDWWNTSRDRAAMSI